MNAQTVDHLELFVSSKGQEKYSLYWLVNKCKTATGQRLLKRWIQNPLFKIEEILDRQTAI
jgi:DNA mismatch repair protein MutS